MSSSLRKTGQKRIRPSSSSEATKQNGSSKTKMAEAESVVSSDVKQETTPIETASTDRTHGRKVTTRPTKRSRAKETLGASPCDIIQQEKVTYSTESEHNRASSSANSHAKQNIKSESDGVTSCECKRTVSKQRGRKKIKMAAEDVSAAEQSLVKVEGLTTTAEDIKRSDQRQTSKKFVGAHTSIAGSLSNAIEETILIGGRALGMFLKSSRTWKSKELEESEVVKFKETLKERGIEARMVVPHGSYLMNCGSSNDEVLAKSRDCLVDELQRCDRLSLPLYNFHPGSSNGVITKDECIARISESINYAHSKTRSVVTVIENMCGQGNTVGGKFSELKQIIDGVENKSRVGICLDTCHAFAAGYDLSSEDGYAAMKAELVSVLGRHNLRAVHLNDSKGDLGCHLDRHEDIGKGKIGKEAFRRIMNDPFFDDLPMILETPGGDYLKEINILYNLCK